MKKITVKLSNKRLITPDFLMPAGGASEKSELVKHAKRMAVNQKQQEIISSRITYSKKTISFFQEDKHEKTINFFRDSRDDV